MSQDTEADTCRKFVVPRLQAAGWDDAPCSINEQRHFTAGRVRFVRGTPRRGKGKRADYILRYRPDYPIAVVEAKAAYKQAADGVQQAKDYAIILGLRFAFATNGHAIIEIDLAAGTERERPDFPSPQELWSRERADLGIADDVAAEQLLEPGLADPAKPLRYYQEIAVNRALAAIHTGHRRSLLVLCTGAGKTAITFQIAWRLWSSGWNRCGQHKKPKILFLADRKVLVDDPKDKDFAPFGDGRFKIEGGEISKSRDVYFSTYQAIAEDKNRPGLYREFGPDFFDLIIVDECHRGSARDDSTWREILNYFEPAYQIGLTATPISEAERDTYNYFGKPLYTYSLAQGIEDGFLAPYRVHRVVTDYDAAGWRPSRDEVDRYGREIPDALYGTAEFERKVALKARTEAIARHLTGFLEGTDLFAKTIVFCVDQDHASEMRAALVRLNRDLVRMHRDYVCRVTSDEGKIGRGHLSDFKDIDKDTPVILTTSQLLTTGVDVPTCRNIVLARVVGSMPEFKQIIGRGTRMREDYGKLFFNIIDYTGTATQMFADPSFDGDPDVTSCTEITAEGEVVEIKIEHESEEEPETFSEVSSKDDKVPLRKFYVDGGEVEIVQHLVFDLDPDGKRLTCRKLIDWTGEKVRVLFPTPDALKAEWVLADKRRAVAEALAERGIDLDALAAETNRPDDDPFDLLCHLAWNAPLRTRRDRAERVRGEASDLLDRHGPDARAVLDALLDKYATHGVMQLAVPDVLKVEPLNAFGNPSEIASRFGGPRALRETLDEMTRRLYAA